MDLTADGRLDLVFFYDECDGAAVGRDYWKVHRGTPAGFDDTPAEYALPGGFDTCNSGAPFWGLGGTWVTCSGATNYYRHGVWDVGADGYPDLVVYKDECADPAAGSDHWRVYPGGDVGFSSYPVEWSLPDGYDDYNGGTPFWGTGGALATCSDSISDYSYGVWDATADGLADLVMFRDDCDDADIGRACWEVYPGTCG